MKRCNPFVEVTQGHAGRREVTSQLTVALAKRRCHAPRNQRHVGAEVWSSCNVLVTTYPVAVPGSYPVAPGPASVDIWSRQPQHPCVLVARCPISTGQAELWVAAPEPLECCENPDDTCGKEAGAREGGVLGAYNGMWEEVPGWAVRRAALQRLQGLVLGTSAAAGAGSQDTGGQTGQEPGEGQLRAALRLADALGVGQRFRRGVRLHWLAAPGAGSAPGAGAATAVPASGVGQSPLQGKQRQSGGLGMQGQARRPGLSGQGEMPVGAKLNFEYGGEIYSWDQPLRVGGPCGVLARCGAPLPVRCHACCYDNAAWLWSRCDAAAAPP